MHALGADPNNLDSEQVARIHSEAQCQSLKQVMEKRGWMASDLLRVPASEIAAIICALQGRAPDLKQLVLALRKFLGDEG
jgi:hypothetical protein